MDDLRTESEIGGGGQTLIVLAVALMAIGLVMVGSAGASLDRSLVEALSWQASFGRQVVFAVVGLALMLIASFVCVPILASQRLRYRLPQVLFVLTLLCLIAAFVPGLADAHRGSHRWLQLGAAGLGLSFQPSEFAKLALVALMASLLAERDVNIRSFFKGFLPPVLALGVCVLLVGMEDFGTAGLFAVVGGLMLLVGGCRFVHLLLVGVAGIFGFVGLLFAAPYRLERIAAYRDLWDDPLGAGYQPLQSLTTIASGGWFGLGLGAGVQKYGYLPEDHSDFIFAVICEEMGVLGAGLVIALFCTLVILGIRTMWFARTPFERLLAFGITSLVGWQAVMNIAVVTVVTPTTGISLPFVSAGGSGLLTFCLAVGTLAAVAARGKPAETVGEGVEAGGAIRFGVGKRKATAW